MRMVFLGPPGAGQGTIAALAREFYGIPHISTGDLFRSNIKNGTALGLRVKSILASGGLVPDSITIEMVRNRLAEPDCEKGFILDGFPRTIPQADALSEMTGLDAVIDFRIPEKEVIKRLSGRRMCPSTGRIYHIVFNPPKVEGKDDETEPVAGHETVAFAKYLEYAVFGVIRKDVKAKTKEQTNHEKDKHGHQSYDKAGPDGLSLC